MTIPMKHLKTKRNRGKARKLSSTAVFPLDRKQPHTPSLSDGLSRANSVETDFTAEQIGKNPLPGIEERRITSSEGSYESPSINAYTEDSKLKGETSLNISKTVENESNSPGGHSLIWPIRGRAAGQGMVFGLLCPEQGIQFYANLS